MSAPAIPATPAPQTTGWSVWRAQVAAITRMELRKNFITKRGFWIYLLALAAPAIIWLHSFAVLARMDNSHPVAVDVQVLGVIFQIFYLKIAIFFGCLGIFTYLFRGEVLEKSFHYYLLAPLRREVLLAGKYLAGAITATFFFAASVLLAFTGMFFHYSRVEVEEFLFAGGGLQQLGQYLGATVLATLGYGAVFLILGIRYRNPIIGGGVLLLWESVNVFLPAAARKISIIYYLKSLMPVVVPREGPGVLFVAVDPAPPWLAVVSLLVLTGVLLVLAARVLQRVEISYSTD